MIWEWIKEFMPETEKNNLIPYRQEIFRKLVHLSSFWMVVVIGVFHSWEVSIFFTALFILSILCEGAYARQVPVITPLYENFFGRMLRKKPDPKQWIVSGGPYVLGAAALVCWLFNGQAGAAALGVMLLADTAAALVGRKFGRHKMANGKSREGFWAFLVAGWLVVGCGALFWQWNLLTVGLGGGGVVAAAYAEIYEKQLHIDDNFSIPVIVGCFLSVGMWLS